MTIISKIMGKATVAKAQDIMEEIKHILIEDETVVLAFKEIRDKVAFTNLRIIFVDHQGVTGKKKEYLSVPYRSISHYAVETAGHLDLDFDLKLWIKGRGPILERKFRKNKDMAYEVIRVLTRHIGGDIN